jgi:hypothetical protein
VFKRKVLRTKDFDSPCVINIVKTKRLRYAGHMIRRPEDLPQKAIVIARRTELRIESNGKNFFDRR